MSGPVLFEVDARGVATVTLNRPELHNAINDAVIARLAEIVAGIGGRGDVRVLLLRGAGKSFCAGADLGGMQQAGAMSYEDNYAGTLRLARLLHAMRSLPQPSLALVHGNCFAGGIGLMSACDIAVATRAATFSVSEVRLGLIAGTISPYLVAKMGQANARRLFLTGERFDGAAAHGFGLVQELADDAAGLDAARDRLIKALLAGAPGALAESKRLIDAVAGRPIDEALMADTARRIAERRATDEAKEGLRAFFEKRKPGWAP